MKVFDIYHHPAHGFRSVKHGFSWPAFLGSGFWALRKGMRGLGAGLLGLSLPLAGLLAAALAVRAFWAAALLGLAGLLVLLFAGRRANHWWRLALRDRGYRRLCTVEGRSPAEAAAQVAPPASGPPTAAEPSTGPAAPPAEEPQSSPDIRARTDSDSSSPSTSRPTSAASPSDPSRSPRATSSA